MNSSEKKLLKKLKEEIKGVSPGVCVQAFHKGRRICDLEVGKTYRFYDLASLTKVISTTTLLMMLAEKKQFDPEQMVLKYLPWFRFNDISVRKLLNHSAGFVWWMPFYKEINLLSPIQDRSFWLERKIRDIDPDFNGTSVYSDIDFFFLKSILERTVGLPIDSAFECVREAFDLKSLFYHRDNKPRFKVSDYAPTETCEWRGKTLQGEVHDENTWALGGVSSHAGLFGAIQDVSKWALAIRMARLGEQKQISRKTAELFTKRSLDSKIGDWALGFMMPTPGSASCGQYFSQESFGHTGFTGTSVWTDPKKDLVVVILSNRVHPTRKNELFRTLRPKIHNWIVEDFNV